MQMHIDGSTADVIDAHRIDTYIDIRGSQGLSRKHIDAASILCGQVGKGACIVSVIGIDNVQPFE